MFVYKHENVASLLFICISRLLIGTGYQQSFGVFTYIIKNTNNNNNVAMITLSDYFTCMFDNLIFFTLKWLSAI